MSRQNDPLHIVGKSSFSITLMNFMVPEHLGHVIGPGMLKKTCKEIMLVLWLVQDIGEKP